MLNIPLLYHRSGKSSANISFDASEAIEPFNQGVSLSARLTLEWASMASFFVCYQHKTL